MLETSSSQVGFLNAVPSASTLRGKLGASEVAAVKDRLTKLLDRPSLCAQICAEGFGSYDRQGQGLLGYVDADSLARALALHLKVPAPRDSQFAALFEAYDDKGNGLVTRDQFAGIFEVCLRYASARFERGEFDDGRSETMLPQEDVCGSVMYGGAPLANSSSRLTVPEHESATSDSIAMNGTLGGTFRPMAPMLAHESPRRLTFRMTIASSQSVHEEYNGETPCTVLARAGSGTWDPAMHANPQDVCSCHPDAYSELQYVPSDAVFQDGSSPAPSLPPTPLLGVTPSASYATLPRTDQQMAAPPPSMERNVPSTDVFEPVDWSSISGFGSPSRTTSQGSIRLGPAPTAEQAVAALDLAPRVTPELAISTLPTSAHEAVQSDDLLPIWTGTPRMRGGSFPAGVQPQPGDSWHNLTPSLPPSGDLSLAATPHATTSSLPSSGDRGRRIEPREIIVSLPPSQVGTPHEAPYSSQSSQPLSRMATQVQDAPYSWRSPLQSSAAQVDIAAPRASSSPPGDTPVVPATLVSLGVMALTVMTSF